MLARVRSGALRGIDALVVDVEVDISTGLPHTTTVGLPDGAVREATDRIRAALRNAGFEYPTRHREPGACRRAQGGSPLRPPDCARHPRGGSQAAASRSRPLVRP